MNISRIGHLEIVSEPFLYVIQIHTTGAEHDAKHVVYAVCPAHGFFFDFALTIPVFHFGMNHSVFIGIPNFIRAIAIAFLCTLCIIKRNEFV